MHRIFTAFVLFMICLQVQAEKIPMMVHSDAKSFSDNGRVNACALLITASNINGEYISVVVKLRRKNDNPVMDYTVLSGTIDYSTGSEVYDYVEDAWLTADDSTTRGQVKTGRGPSDYAFMATYTDNALGFYEALVQEPFDLTLITAMHNKPYTHTFEQPFDQFVSGEADSCLRAFRRKAELYQPTAANQPYSY